MAAVKPRSEKVSLVLVPLAERAVSTAVVPFFNATRIASSSVLVAGQAHSPSMNRSKLEPSMVALTVEPGANG